MLTIDGRPGGGQILRTSLCLSAIEQTPFTIEKIRGSRPEPGLKPQHLATIRTVATLCDAEVTGSTLGSTELAFEPGPLRANSIDIDIGTAGSMTLLFDAVLPIAVGIEDVIVLMATGGTDVKWSPSMAYFRRVKLPLLARFGYLGSVEVERTGFYPEGGGRASLTIEPATIEPIQLLDRGLLDQVDVCSKASEGLAKQEVAERQAQRAALLLEREDIPVRNTAVDHVESTSDGSALLVRADYQGSVVGFDALGERGKPSEAVAEHAVSRFLDFHHGEASVDTYMGDQILVFLAIAGGQVRAPRLTDHLESNVSVIEQFGYNLEIDRRPDGSVVVTA